MGQYLICATAKQEPRDSTAAMRRHDNEIASFAFSSRNDAFSRMLILYVDPIASQAVCIRALRSILENTSRCRSRNGLELTDRIGPTLSCLLGHFPSQPGLRYGDDGDPCIVVLGESQPMFKCLCCQFGAVGRN